MEDYASIKHALETSVKDTNRVLRTWKKNNPNNFSHFDSIRGMLIGWIFRHLKGVIGYRKIKNYGKPIINVDYARCMVIGVTFPSTYGEHNYINSICDALDYDKLQQDSQSRYAEALPTEVKELLSLSLSKIDNIKF